MKTTLTLLLLSACLALAMPPLPTNQPPPKAELQIQLTGGQLSTFGIWEFHDYGGNSLGRWLYWNMVVTNAGAATWMPRYQDIGTDWTGWFWAVQDFYYVVLSDPTGNVVFEEAKSLGSVVRVIRPGDSIIHEPFLDGCWLWLGHNYPPGRYSLQLIVDPFNLWGQASMSEWIVDIDGFNARRGK